ncbi:30S ribosomal protein S27e [Candidatus Pacearchaeota archaeon]|nr:30S ribosomal protein S27e [Candidatus Pacearchaeota archaeon]
MNQTKKPGKFLKIRCPRCKQIHIVFGKCSTKIKCEKCNRLLVKTSGGKIRVKAIIQEILQ